MTDRIVDQPAPIPNDQVGIWQLVIEDMQARDRVGRERYGTPLQTHNGRDPLVDAYQEALDLVVYLRQAIEERATSIEGAARRALARLEERHKHDWRPDLVLCGNELDAIGILRNALDPK